LTARRTFHFIVVRLLAGIVVSAPQAACTIARTVAAVLEDAEDSSEVVYRRVAPRLQCLGYQETTASAYADTGDWDDAPEIDCPEGLAFDIVSCDCSAEASAAAAAALVGPMCSYQTAADSAGGKVCAIRTDPLPERRPKIRCRRTENQRPYPSFCSIHLSFARAPFTFAGDGFPKRTFSCCWLTIPELAVQGRRVF